MTDRELLELAAKAAGLIGYEYEEGLDGRQYMAYDSGGSRSHYWLPLDDDGDALRLACDLGLQVYPVARMSSGAACSAVASVTGMRLSEIADHMHDTRSATRRAIVRAAAELGKQMK